jgi:hypothetical protein
MNWQQDYTRATKSDRTSYKQCCGTETVGTVAFCLSGTETGTVIKWNHISSHSLRHSLKLCI